MRIPRGWEKAKIAELGTVTGGRQRSPHLTKGSLRPYLRVANVFDGFIDTSDVKAMLFTDEEYESFRLKDGDVLLNEGQSLDLVGRSAIYRGKPRGCCFQNTLVRFRADTGRMLPELAQLLFQHLRHVGKFAAIATRTTSIAHLGLNRFAQLSVAVPPLPEQRKIARILGTWDKALVRLDTLLAPDGPLPRRQIALAQELLARRRRLLGFTGKWKRVRIGDVLAECHRYVVWNDKTAYRFASVRRRCGGLFDRGTAFGHEVKTKTLKLLRAGDFVISKRQVVHGAWALVTPEFNGFGVSDEYDVLVTRDAELLDTGFFNHLAQRPRMIRNAYLACNGVHLEKMIFDWDYFAREHIDIPPTADEQRAIAAVLDAGAREVALRERERAALRQQKRALLQRLLTGQTRVRPDPEDFD